MNSLPSNSDEIKKWIDDAVKKINDSGLTQTEPGLITTPKKFDIQRPDLSDRALEIEREMFASILPARTEEPEPETETVAAQAPVDYKAPETAAASKLYELEEPEIFTAPAPVNYKEPEDENPDLITSLFPAKKEDPELAALLSYEHEETELREPVSPKYEETEPENAALKNAAPEDAALKNAALKSRAKKVPELDTGPADFKIKFDFDAAYIDVPVEKPIRLRREKRTGCVGGILYFAFIVCLSLVLAALAWLAASDILGFGVKDEMVNVTVKKGFTIDEVTDTLYDAGLIKYKFLFSMYANYSKAEKKISAGTYSLNRNYDYRALVYGMVAKRGELIETSVTIPEGFSLAEIFTRFEDHGVCSAADLWEVATKHDFKYDFLDKSTLGDRHRLEGFLFPDTYNFYLDSPATDVVNRLLAEFNRRFTETYIVHAADLGYSVREIITVASMIEREAGSDEERPRIAAVIYNRLNNPDKFPFLQIDATYVYAAAGTGRPPSVDIDSPYNTYLHEGLPPGPIANPGMASIRAALYPDSTNEFYYALNKQGTHAFFTTRAQHEAFIASNDYGGKR